MPKYYCNYKPNVTYAALGCKYTHAKEYTDNLRENDGHLSLNLYKISLENLVQDFPKTILSSNYHHIIK